MCVCLYVKSVGGGSVYLRRRLSTFYSPRLVVVDYGRQFSERPEREKEKKTGPSILTYWYMWSLQFLVQDSTPPTRRAFLLFPIFHDIITYIDIRCCWPTHIQVSTPVPCLLLAKNALPKVNKTRSVNASAFRVWSMEIQCHTPITIFPLRQTIMTTSRPVNAAALRI